MNTSSKKAIGAGGCVIAIIFLILSMQEIGARIDKEKSAAEALRAAHGEQISPSSEALE